MKTNKQIRLLMVEQGLELQEKEQELDQIIVTQEDVYSCFKKQDETNYVGLLNGLPILKKGAFIQKTDSFTDHLLFEVYEISENGFKMHCQTFQTNAKNESPLWCYNCDAYLVNGVFRHINEDIEIQFHSFSNAHTSIFTKQKRGELAQKHTDEHINEYTANIWTMYKVMAWMNWLSEHPEEKIIEKDDTKYLKNHRRNIKPHINTSSMLSVSSNQPHTIKINGIRIISTDSQIIRKIKSRTRQRFTETWCVRGHYRHYQNGKTIYIKPYIKGKKDGAFVKKEYRLDFSKPIT